MADCVVEAVSRKKDWVRQIQELKFQEVWHIRNKSNVNFDKILEALMDTDADGKMMQSAPC